MNGNTSFLVNASHLLGMNVLSIGVGLVSSIFIARLLGPQSKGNYDLIIATSGLLSVFLGFSLSSGISFTVASGKANLQKLSWHLGVTIAIQLVVAYLILVLGGQIGFTSTLLPSSLSAPVVGVTVLLFGLQTFRGYWRSMLIGMQRIIFVNRCDLFVRSSQLALIVCISAGSVLLHRPVPLMAMVVVSLLAAAIGNGMYLQGLWGSLRNSVGSSGYSSIAKYSLPSYVANTAQFLSYRVDVFLVNWFSGSVAVGLYVLAASIAELVWLLPSAAATALFPRVAAAHTQHHENEALASRACRIAFWLSLGAGIMLGVLGYALVPLVYGEAFSGSRIPLLLLLPGVIGFSVVTVLAAYIAGMGRPQINMLVSLAGALITIAGDLWLIPRYGIAGAASVSSVSYLVSALLTVFIFIWKTGASLSSIIVISREDIEIARGWIRHDALKQARYLLGMGN